MLRTLRGFRRQAGTTLTEVTISSALLVMMLSMGVPLFKSIGDAGDEGASRLSTQAENQQALLKISGEIQNSSTTASDPLGNPRLSIASGVAPQPLWDWRDGQLSMGGFMGTLGSYTTGQTAPTNSTSGSLIEATTGTTVTNTSASMGSGDRSTTQFGRVRQSDRGTAIEVGTVSMRPRFKAIPTNSLLRFQKVVGYTVAADGTPQVNWGPQIEYRVEKNKLIRRQSGQDRVIASFVVAFRAELTDAGTVAMTLVTQKRVNSNGKVTYQANQIEISPKN